MPQLKPETISMTGLNLFQHLCNLARLATSTYDGGSNSEVSLDPVHKFFFFQGKGKTYIAYLQLYLFWEHTGLKIVYRFELLSYSLLSTRQYGFLHWGESCSHLSQRFHISVCKMWVWNWEACNPYLSSWLRASYV